MTEYSLPSAIDTIVKCVDNMLYGVDVDEDAYENIISSLIPKFQQMQYCYAFIKDVIASFNPTSAAVHTNVQLARSVIQTGQSYVNVTYNHDHARVFVRQALLERARLSELTNLFMCRQDNLPATVQAVNDTLSALVSGLSVLDTIAAKY